MSEYKVMNHKALSVAAAAMVVGCATTSADFRMSTVARDEAAIAGRLTIIYNGTIFTENCHATFGLDNLKLSPGGVVLFRVKKGWTSLERLDCKDTSNQHIRIRGAHFYAQGDGSVTDFGDVAITWANAGGFKASSAFGLIGAIIDESTDDGAASVEVKPPVAEVREAFQRQTGVEGRWSVHPLSQPKNAIAPTSASDPAAPAPAGQRGFFCTISSGRSRLSICEREHAVCERARSVLATSGLGACTSAETAWCFVAEGKLRCSGTQAACDVQHDKARTTTDVCGEQY